MFNYQSAFPFTAMPCFTTAAQMCPTRSVTCDFRLTDKEREKIIIKAQNTFKKLESQAAMMRQRLGHLSVSEQIV